MRRDTNGRWDLKTATIDDCLELQRNIRLRGIGNPFIARAGNRWNLFEQVSRPCEDGRFTLTLEPRKTRVTIPTLYAALEAVSMPSRMMPV